MAMPTGESMDTKLTLLEDTGSMGNPYHRVALVEFNTVDTVPRSSATTTRLLPESTIASRPP